MGALDRSRIVAVVGAGTMGAGVAQIAAQSGYPVMLYDVREGAPAAAIRGIQKVLGRRVEKGKMAAADVEALLTRITPCAALEQLADAALVIEAVVEDLDIKQKLFRDLEDLLSDEAILATNTSSISVTAIGSGLRRPERLVGMHFFNPVPLMALVEIISGLATDPAMAETVFATAKAWGKHPVYAKSTPGFIVNRVARPYYAEALRVLQEGGADPVTLDAVLRDCGNFRMGPFELMDLIGHDVNFAVTRSVFDAYFGDPRFTPSLIQQELVEAGFLGRKSGRGFYSYAEGSTRPRPRQLYNGIRPDIVVLHGSRGMLAEVATQLQTVGLKVVKEQDSDADAWLELDGKVALALTDGRTATHRMAEDVNFSGLDLVLVDHARHFDTAERVALCVAGQADKDALEIAAGLFQSLDKSVTPIADIPGMLVMRTVCMLANEGADAVNQGVCDVAGVNTAMRKGVNYPEGPLTWANRIGVDQVVKVLRNLGETYGEDRYRVSPLLQRVAHLGAEI